MRQGSHLAKLFQVISFFVEFVVKLITKIYYLNYKTLNVEYRIMSDFLMLILDAYRNVCCIVGASHKKVVFGDGLL